MVERVLGNVIIYVQYKDDVNAKKKFEQKQLKDAEKISNKLNNMEIKRAASFRKIWSQTFAKVNTGRLKIAAALQRLSGSALFGVLGTTTLIGGTAALLNRSRSRIDFGRAVASDVFEQSKDIANFASLTGSSLGSAAAVTSLASQRGIDQNTLERAVARFRVLKEQNTTLGSRYKSNNDLQNLLNFLGNIGNLPRGQQAETLKSAFGNAGIVGLDQLVSAIASGEFTSDLQKVLSAVGGTTALSKAAGINLTQNKELGLQRAIKETQKIVEISQKATELRDEIIRIEQKELNQLKSLVKNFEALNENAKVFNLTLKAINGLLLKVETALGYIIGVGTSKGANLPGFLKPTYWYQSLFNPLNQANSIARNPYDINQNNSE